MRATLNANMPPTFFPAGGPKPPIALFCQINVCCVFQEELFHDRLLQGLPGGPAAGGRDGAGANVDKTVARGRAGGLGTHLHSFIFYF